MMYLHIGVISLSDVRFSHIGIIYPSGDKSCRYYIYIEIDELSRYNLEISRVILYLEIDKSSKYYII